MNLKFPGGHGAFNLSILSAASPWLKPKSFKWHSGPEHFFYRCWSRIGGLLVEEFESHPSTKARDSFESLKPPIQTTIPTGYLTLVSVQEFPLQGICFRVRSLDPHNRWLPLSFLEKRRSKGAKDSFRTEEAAKLSTLVLC